MANAQFESALDRLADAVKDVFRELYAAVPVSAPAAAPAVATVIAPAPPVAATGPGTALLCTGFGRILAAGSQTDVMQTLLDSAEGYTNRSAILVVKGDKLTPWRWRGFDDAAQAGWRSLNVSSDGDAGWRAAINSSSAMPATVGSMFFQAVGKPGDGKAYLI